MSLCRLELWSEAMKERAYMDRPMREERAGDHGIGVLTDAGGKW